MTYHQPRSLDEAFAVLARPAVSVIAGGTDWFPARGDRTRSGEICDITRLPGFAGIARTEGGWRIGAATCWSAIARAALPPGFDGLRAAARQIGALQVQNAGTIGGNLVNASPAADGVPPLVTLGATVELVSASGARSLPLAEFLLGPRRTALAPGELLAAVHVPPLPEGACAGFVKLGARAYMVISIAMVAVLLVTENGRISDARVAVGACSPVARRLPELEAALCGAPLRECAAVVREDHLAGLSPISDIRGSAEYRAGVGADLVRRALTLAGAAHG